MVTIEKVIDLMKPFLPLDKTFISNLIVIDSDEINDFMPPLAVRLFYTAFLLMKEEKNTIVILLLILLSHLIHLLLLKTHLTLLNSYMKVLTLSFRTKAKLS